MSKITISICMNTMNMHQPENKGYHEHLHKRCEGVPG